MSGIQASTFSFLNELKEIKHDNELCDMVTQAVRVKVTVAYAKNISDKDSSTKPIEKLREFDILVPGGDMPSPSTFLPKAYEFYKSAEVHYERDGDVLEEI